jgi:predicted nucleic acid-binding protein
MNDRFFLDTNIFIYSIDRRDAVKELKATELIRESLSSLKGVVSFQVVHEFFNVATKRLAAPMSIESAQLYLERVFLPLLGVHSSVALYQEALAFRSRYQFSWYDSLIVCAALRAECAILFSEDLQHNQTFGKMRVVNPFL